MRQSTNRPGQELELLATGKKWELANWLRIESGTNKELVLAKNKEGREPRTKNDSDTSDMATTPI